MSKVKFVQIGNDRLDFNTYTEKLTAALSNYPGALIFGTYWDEAKGDIAQEIWANGKKYSVGSGSNVKIYEDSSTPENYMDEHSITPKHGDYYIQISSLSPASEQDIDSDTGLHVERRTAYIYDSTIKRDDVVVGGWAVLDGNVSADNVYFPNGIRHNQLWGTEPAMKSGSKVSCEGYNLTNVMRHFLLSSGSVPSVRHEDNLGQDPKVTVSSADVITYKIYQDDVGNTVAANDQWWEVGTKLYIPSGKVISYSGYNLTLTSEDTFVKEGGLSIEDMEHGYWASSEAISGGERTVTKQSVKRGESVNAYVTHNENQTDGTCSLTMNVSGITYTTPSGLVDSVSTNTPSVDIAISIPSAATRTFTVEEGTSGVITFTGVNGNTWGATREQVTIPQVGPVWIANNTYDQSQQDSYGPKTISEATLVSDAIGNTTSTFTVKGYYPVYSNITKSSYTSDTELINKATKNDYDWSFTTNWSSGQVGRPIYIEYPKSKTLKVYVDGLLKDFSSTRVGVKKPVGGQDVDYWNLHSFDNFPFSEGQTFRFVLS